MESPIVFFTQNYYGCDRPHVPLSLIVGNDYPNFYTRRKNLSELFIHNSSNFITIGSSTFFLFYYSNLIRGGI